MFGGEIPDQAEEHRHIHCRYRRHHRQVNREAIEAKVTQPDRSGAERGDNVLAPFAGALVYGAIHTMAYDLSPNTWQMSLGTALLVLIVFLPEGIWSLSRFFKVKPT